MWGPPEFTSEIEPFPSAVLAHHYPDVPNLGDMTKYKEWPDYDLGLICGGTPCQSFSIAGLRKGMDDPRGNLTLAFLGILARYNPRWFVFENVPGLFSSVSYGESDFGRFLSALAELGYSCAYRVLDAQYFGVPQRRRRIFVVGHLGDDWRPPFAVLFEPESLRGNTPKSRKEGKGIARSLRAQSQSSHREDSDNFVVFENHRQDARITEVDVCPTIYAKAGTGGGNLPLVMAHGQGNAEIVKDGSPSLTCNHEAPIVAVHARQDPITLKDKALPLDVKGNTQAIAIHPHAIGRKDNAGPQAKPYRTDGKAYTHDSRGTAQVVAIQDGAVAFAQNTRNEVRLVGGDGSIVGALAAEPGMKQTSYIKTASIVRRLTPKECERLQGFPDDYTLIPWRKGMATDGPRYKALGNSMAVPVVRWIGRRIQMWEDTIK